MSVRRNPLQFVTALMAVLTVVFGAAMLLDPRTIDGAPAWLKPAKFAVSTAIYSATLAWVLTHLPGWPRLRRVAAVTTATVFVVEVALIAVQAGRGTYSHFNSSRTSSSDECSRSTRTRPASAAVEASGASAGWTTP